MLRIVDCLTLEHDLSLVFLAALICLLGCMACLAVAGRALNGERQRLWMTLLGISAGCTVWSTHFIAMLAYQTSVPMTYDVWMTVLSLLVGTILVSLGFALAFHYRQEMRLRLLGGMVVGAGVVSLHYIGMAGLIFPGSMTYDLDLVLASLLAATVFGGLAVEQLFADRTASHRLVAGAWLLLMIVSLHFLGMSATRMELGLYDEAHGVTRAFLITGVALASLIVLVIGSVAALLDQRMSLRLATQAERFRMLADGAFEGLIVHRDLTILDSNLAARRLLGLEDRKSTALLSDWGISAASGLTVGGEPLTQEIHIRRNGLEFPAEICRRAILLQDDTVGELIAIRDLTQRKESEARITHLALHDPLTDLPNRRSFHQMAARAIATAERSGHKLALMALDLDNFKAVNDMYGHGTGDELIRQVARRLRSLVSGSDVVSRQGGDEFMILCASPEQPGCCVDLARRIHDTLDAGIDLQSAQVLSHVSIGIAIYPTDGTSLEELMRNADTAMYESKAEGRGCTHFFKPEMNVQLDKRRTMETRLQKALELGALSMNYQPLVSCEDNTTICFEALLRWNDPELGPVSPADFIPIAEQTGLIVPIGEYVLQQACQDAVTWPEHIRVAVNLSVAQFAKQDIVKLVADTLDRTGLDGHRLELEITESLLMENKTAALKTLDALRSMGVHIAMDDFGTGYSSLSYLQSFNFNKLKIDRAFVSDLESNPQNASIVKAVVSMGKSLQMRVVAEGVETREQAEILSGLACDELQGYLISRPMPAVEVLPFIERTLPRPSEDDDDIEAWAA